MNGEKGLPATGAPVAAVDPEEPWYEATNVTGGGILVGWTDELDTIVINDVGVTLEADVELTDGLGL